VFLRSKYSDVFGKDTMLAMRSTQDSTIPPSQASEFLRKEEVDLYRSPWQYIRSDLVALREMANTGDSKQTNTEPTYSEI